MAAVSIAAGIWLRRWLGPRSAAAREQIFQLAAGRDRQSALMNVVALTEKLTQRTSPWYVRHKEVIASAVAVVGALSGLVTAYSALRGAVKP